MLKRWGVLAGTGIFLLAGCAAGDGLGRGRDAGPAAVDTADAVCRSGQKELEAGDVERAVATFDRALRLDPGHPEALYGRGLCRYRTGDVEGAVRDYDAALRSASGALLRSVQVNDAGTYSDRGRAVALSRLLVEIRVSRGIAREARGDAAGAREDFDEARAIDERQADEALERARRAIRGPQGAGTPRGRDRAERESPGSRIQH